MPEISQWPMVVSFPLDASRMRATAARGEGTDGCQSMPSMLNRPRDSMFGMWKYRLVAALFKVLVPSSPYSAASGSAPMPTLSRTMRKIRFLWDVSGFMVYALLFYGGRWAGRRFAGPAVAGASMGRLAAFSLPELRSALDSAPLHLVHGLRPMRKGRGYGALMQAWGGISLPFRALLIACADIIPAIF